MVRSRSSIALILTLLLTMPGCFSGWASEPVIQKRHNISHVTLDGDALYFGAGYHLYRLDLASRSLETIFSSDRLLIEQPIVAGGTVYFGGLQYTDEFGHHPAASTFFALDLGTRTVQWKFPLGAGGYGSYGTYPVLAGDRVLVCAREHLHCLDRQSGKEFWHVDNWMGRVSDGVKRPYVYNNSVYYMIAEESVADSRKTDENDGHWAEVALDSGNRSMFRIADHPGTWNDSSGTGNGALVDGVIYGVQRVDRFGALDLKTKKMLWEIQGTHFTQPAVDNERVFTARQDSIQAVERNTGKVLWSVPLGDLAKLDLDRSKERPEFDYENYWSRRFVLSGDVLVVQGSQGIAAFRAADGKALWFAKSVDDGMSEPVIWRNMIIASSQQSCSIFALDLQTGREIWRVAVPDCKIYQVMDD